MIVSLLTWLDSGGTGSFAEFYANSLRSNLFSGFLTLCAFLFSVKTFLLVTLEKEVYSRSEYGARIGRLCQVKSKITRYGQLKRLNSTMYLAVVFTFATAIAQLTVGIVDANWAALLCVAVATIASVDVAYNLYVQRTVIADWLEFLEEKSQADEPPDADDDES